MRNKWLKCTRCDLHKTRRNVVLGRGDLPCDLLFITEAPGKVEDLQAKPFVGSNGRMLDYMLERAAEIADVPLPSFFIACACACRPTDSLTGPNFPPTDAQLFACQERLMWEASKAQALRTILIGKVVQKACAKVFPGSYEMYHPSFILRGGGPKSPYYRREVRNLSVIFKELYDAKKAKRKGVNKRHTPPRKRRHYK